MTFTSSLPPGCRKSCISSPINSVSFIHLKLPEVGNELDK